MAALKVEPGETLHCASPEAARLHSQAVVQIGFGSR